MFHQFKFLGAVLTLSGLQPFRCSGVSESDKFWNYFYVNALTFGSIVQFFVEGRSNESSFSRIVNRAQRDTVLGLEIWLLFQTLASLWIIRNSCLLYWEKHEKLLAKLENLCLLFGFHWHLIRWKYYLILMFLIATKAISVVIYFIELTEVSVLLMMCSITFNGFTILTSMIESCIVINILGVLFSYINNAETSEVMFNRYAVVLLEMMDEVNNSYGFIFLLGITHQFTWLMVVLYKNWIFPEEMALFRNQYLRCLNRMVISPTIVILLDFMFTCHRTSQQVIKLRNFVLISIKLMSQISSNHQKKIFHSGSVCCREWTRYIF